MGYRGLLLRTIPEDTLNDIRVAWPVARAHLINSKLNIKEVKGIMSNVILTLLKANWVPRQYNVWEDNQGSTWALTSKSFSPDVVASALIRAFL